MTRTSDQTKPIEFRRAAIARCEAAGLKLPKLYLRNWHLKLALEELASHPLAVVQERLLTRMDGREPAPAPKADKGWRGEYLLKDRAQVAHYWTGSDTLCRLWSTGGIVEKSAFSVSGDDKGRRICLMCGTCWRKRLRGVLVTRARARLDQRSERRRYAPSMDDLIEAAPKASGDYTEAEREADRQRWAADDEVDRARGFIGSK